MGFEELHRLFQRCLDLAERVGPEDRETLLQIAEACLQLARDCRDKGAPQQNAPTTALQQ